MSILEGFLLVPPDRGSLIGRVSWKPRYIVLGTQVEPNMQNSALPSSDKSSKSRIHLKSTSKPDLTDISETNDEPMQLYLSIFKAKGEWEYLAHHPISAIQFCEIRSIQHRKQTPPHPTLVVEFKPESTTSKLRKRRSSRAGLTLKDGYSNALLFRSAENERYSIYDWVVQLKLLLTAPSVPGDSAFSSLVNVTSPFMNRSNSSSTKKTESQGKYSEVISPSPSLRSKRSDISSKASSLAQGSGLTSPLAITSGVNSDLPSPSLQSGYDNHLIEGWTSAQGRTSALSSHTRGNNSNASGITTITSRETILDRAFQMRCIPGSDRLPSPEDIDRVSSTARFEALMRENDERRRAKGSTRSKSTLPDENLEEFKIENNNEVHQDDSYIRQLEKQLSIPAQMALDFISGRRAPILQSFSPTSKEQVPTLNTQALSALLGDDGPVDEHESIISRTDTSSRRNSSRPSTLTIPLNSYSSTTISNKEENSNYQSNSKIDINEKRLSSSSIKRLSFQEFARRLSSTSSLLLVQTNASSNSGRGCIDYTTELTVNPRGYTTGDERDHRCSWRSSVSALGVEGTFM